MAPRALDASRLRTIKTEVERNGKNASRLGPLLLELRDSVLTAELLRDTGIGKAIGALHMHADRNVANASKALAAKWKELLRGGSAKIAVPARATLLAPTQPATLPPRIAPCLALTNHAMTGRPPMAAPQLNRPATDSLAIPCAAYGRGGRATISAFAGPAAGQAVRATLHDAGNLPDKDAGKQQVACGAAKGRRLEQKDRQRRSARENIDGSRSKRYERGKTDA